MDSVQLIAIDSGINHDNANCCQLMRIGVEFRQTTIINPSLDEGRLSYYLAQCQDKAFICQHVSRVKAKILRLVKYYTFTLAPPMRMIQQLPV